MSAVLAIVLVWAVSASYAALRLHGLLLDAERDYDRVFEMTTALVEEERI